MMKITGKRRWWIRYSIRMGKANSHDHAPQPKPNSHDLSWNITQRFIFNLRISSSDTLLPHSSTQPKIAGGSPRFRRAPCWWWWFGIRKRAPARKKGTFFRISGEAAAPLPPPPRLGMALSLVQTIHMKRRAWQWKRSLLKNRGRNSPLSSASGLDQTTDSRC